MVIMVTTEYPVEHADRASELFLKVMSDNPLPDFVTSKGLYVRVKPGVGVRNIETFDFDESKMADAHREIARYAVSFREIPGYTYEIDVAYEATEAITLIGKG